MSILPIKKVENIDIIFFSSLELLYKYIVLMPPPRTSLTEHLLHDLFLQVFRATAHLLLQLYLREFRRFERREEGILGRRRTAATGRGRRGGGRGRGRGGSISESYLPD